MNLQNNALSVIVEISGYNVKNKIDETIIEQALQEGLMMRGYHDGSWGVTAIIQ